MTMTVINRTLERIRLETRTRILAVLAVTDITPHMRRIRVGGPDLEGFQSPGHADHIKVFLSADGRPLPRPERHPDGLVWPDDVPRPFMRDYTPRYFDPAALTLDLDFVLHSDGPASTWAQNAKVGDPLMIGGPRGTIRVPEAFDWYFLAGDETALPAIGRRIEELPADKPVLAIIEVPEAADQQPFAPRENLAIQWINRNGLAAGAENLILELTANTAFPPGDGFAFVAGEAQMAKSLRAHLVARGFPNDYIRAAGYWVRGEASE
jgi:NADPH-dependent ferric siderophore reductase